MKQKELFEQIQKIVLCANDGDWTLAAAHASIFAQKVKAMNAVIIQCEEALKGVEFKGRGR